MDERAVVITSLTSKELVGSKLVANVIKQDELQTLNVNKQLEAY